jgi:hypothetical protein
VTFSVLDIAFTDISATCKKSVTGKRKKKRGVCEGAATG